MKAIIAMQRPVDDMVDRSSGRKARFIERARELLSICSRANNAACTYEDLERLSDEELAKRGLKRSDLSRAAFDKLTER